MNVSLSNSNPSLILLNEINLAPSKKLTLQGFTALHKCEGPYTGAAILIKEDIKYENIPLLSNSILAIKIFTMLGPLVICTLYSPPRIKTLPTTDINRVLNLNLPTIFAADFNAHHPTFHNVKANNHADVKGNQLASICNSRDLYFKGPYFNTFLTSNRKGKPDLVLTNNKFNIFHLNIKKEKPLGSDHIPIIISISTKPFKILTKSKPNFRKLQIENFKNHLSTDSFISLQDKDINELDHNLELITTKLVDAATKFSPTSNIHIIKTYTPTKGIKLKLRQYQTAYLSHCNLGYPSLETVKRYNSELLEKIQLHFTFNWEKLVKTAAKYYGEPHRFWQHINFLRQEDPSPISHLKEVTMCDDSEDSDFGQEEIKILTNPEDQANLISKTWSKVFENNKGNEYVNNNTRKVLQWFNKEKRNLEHTTTINLDNLKQDHPLLRPIEEEEFSSILAKLKDKSPGPDTITSNVLQAIPQNYKHAIIQTYNAVIASKYWPSSSKIANTIFIKKPNKDPTDPLSYRPISLLNILAKILEKILGDRIMYYLEHHNFFKEEQFGFRKNRSTNQALCIILETIKHNNHQNRVSLLVTRDIQKAFDKLWHKGLVYKLFHNAGFDMDSTALIYNYVINRTINPKWQGVFGPSLTPKAGVPQGSCLGPILYIIYVNDMPKPLFSDTIYTQFADDLIFVIRSDTSRNNKPERALEKLQQELTRITNWERKWKIKSNISKSTLVPFGCFTTTLEDLGGFSIDNKHIQIASSVKILGFTICNRSLTSNHITNLANTASFNLTKLNKFKCAPPNVKKQLYLSLIFPLTTVN